MTPKRTKRWLAAALGAGMVASAGAAAQQGKKQNGQVDGSPLDTFMGTRLTTEVPEAKDFVRESRPSPDGLHYQPTYGVDAERPKLRTAAELKAMQGDLESAAARNQGRAGRKAKAPAPAPK